MARSQVGECPHFERVAEPPFGLPRFVRRARRPRSLGTASDPQAYRSPTYAFGSCRPRRRTFRRTLCRPPSQRSRTVVSPRTKAPLPRRPVPEPGLLLVSPASPCDGVLPLTPPRYHASVRFANALRSRLVTLVRLMSERPSARLAVTPAPAPTHQSRARYSLHSPAGRCFVDPLRDVNLLAAGSLARRFAARSSLRA